MLDTRKVTKYIKLRYTVNLFSHQIYLYVSRLFLIIQVQALVSDGTNENNEN
jgi:hypothetical protein